jgi:hypothetical protein
MLENQQAILSALTEVKGKMETIPESLSTTANQIAENLASQHRRLGSRLDDALEVLSGNIDEFDSESSQRFEEMKSTLEETKEILIGIQTLQTRKLYALHERPALFHVSKVEAKSMAEIGQSKFQICLRVHFACERCGILAPSGIKPGETPASYWNRFKAALSRSSATTTEHNQGGYELNVDRPWFTKFKTGLELALKATEFAVRIAGLPVPQLSQFCERINFPDGILDLTTKIGEDVEKILRTLSSERKLDENDETFEIRKKEYWLKNQPEFTLEHVRLVEELLIQLGDARGHRVGLSRCVRDGDIAWVCCDEQNPECRQKFLNEGRSCCIVIPKLK